MDLSLVTAGLPSLLQTPKTWNEWISNPWYCWGVGGYLASAVGYFLFSLLLEMLISIPLGQQYIITYGKSREVEREQTRAKVSFRTQLTGAAWEMLGPPGVLNAAVAAVLLPWLVNPAEEALPSLSSLLAGWGVMVIVNDFTLYWGHRVQHESDFLWERCHSVHHTIGSPTPVSTVYIDPIDMTLQGGIPILTACAAAAMAGWLHPVTFYVFVCARVGENVYNHSGLDCWWTDILSLKCLPGRASVAHHDAHHRFSNYARNAKNYGESFWVWDWAFGTLSNARRRPNRAKQAP